MISNQIIKFQIYSNRNQVTRFLNQITVLQMKSLCMIQSWFKSNYDLDLPTTES